MSTQRIRLRQLRRSAFPAAILVLLYALILLLPIPLTSQAAPIEIRAHHDATTTSPWHIGLMRFAELVDKKSNSNLKVRIFPPGQLSQSNMRTTIELLQAGSIHCALILPNFYEAFDQRFMIYGMPFLFMNREKTFHVLDGSLGEKVLAMMSDKGIQGLAYWDMGYLQLTNSKRPIRSPEDLRGLKIRTTLSPVMASIFKTLGVVTAATPMGEAYMALQQKMVDGQVNPYNTTYRRKFYEVQKYLTEWNFQFLPLLVGMNLNFFRGLPTESQKILISAAREAAPYQRKLSADEDDQMRNELVVKGMELTILNQEQVAAFKKATEPVYKEFEAQIGKELLQEFVNSLK